MKHYYEHLGYYNLSGDIKELAIKSADEIVNYFKHNFGGLYPDLSNETDTDLILEEEEINEEFMLDSTGQYIIINSTRHKSFNVKELCDDPNGDTDWYIDLYLLYKVEDNGIEFFRHF